MQTQKSNMSFGMAYDVSPNASKKLRAVVKQLDAKLNVITNGVTLRISEAVVNKEPKQTAALLMAFPKNYGSLINFTKAALYTLKNGIKNGITMTINKKNLPELNTATISSIKLDELTPKNLLEHAEKTSNAARQLFGKVPDRLTPFN